jgi:sulfite exporter TauE/SafE
MLLSTALLVGFLGSFHCLGMCAPITWAIPDQSANRKKWLVNKLIYNFGRIITYTLLGALVGLVGEMFSFAGFQQWLSIIAGSTLIIGVFLFGGKIPGIAIFKPLTNFMVWVKSKMSKLITAKGWRANISLGIVNGFLPCGLVYAALIGAISMGDLFGGAVYMTFFGLGTLPMMIAAAVIGKTAGTTFKSRIANFTPMFMVILGILFILRGLNLGIPYVSPKLTDNNEIMNCALDVNQETTISFLEQNKSNN